MTIASSCTILSVALPETWSLEGLVLPSELVIEARGPTCPRGRELVEHADAVLAGLPSHPVRPPELGPLLSVDAEALIVAAIRLGDRLHALADRPDELRVHTDRLRYGMAPALMGLGLWELKRRLEDLALWAETPKRYEAIEQAFAEFRAQHEGFVCWGTELLAASLTSAGIDADVVCLFCGIDGASRRLKALEQLESFTATDPTFSRARPTEFFDLFVLVPEGSAYVALEAIHGVAVPVPGTFEDRIAVPRTNGFSGLMSRVSLVRNPRGSAPEADIAQVIIQTQLMHEIARHGVAHPECYGRLTGALSGSSRARYVNLLVESVNERRSASGTQSERRRIQVFTVGGKSRQPQSHFVLEGATVLDLAYKIHTTIGNGVQAARVNGKSAPLSSLLSASDVVVFTRVGATARSEADLPHVTTRNARKSLRRLLNRDTAIRGRNLLRGYLLESRGIALEREELDVAAERVLPEFAQWLHEPNLPVLYRAVGEENDKRLAAGRVGASIAEALSVQGKTTPVYPETPTMEWRPILSPGLPASSRRVKLCGRCVPITSDAIVGVQLKRQITVHTPRCVYARAHDTLPMEWQRLGRSVQSEVHLFCEDRPGLVQAICKVVARRGSGLEEIDAKADEFGRARVRLQVYSHSAVALGDLIDDLRGIRSVRTVTLGDATLSSDERQGVEGGDWRQARKQVDRDGATNELILIDPPRRGDQRRGSLVSPYRPQKPTYASHVFFGRDAEIALLIRRIAEASGRYVLLTGPRRIGKTSLALRFVDHLPADDRPHQIRVDLRDSKRAASADVLQKIATAMQVVRPGAHRAPSDSLTALIDDIVATSDRRVLLVLDEFGAVLESYAHGTLGDEFLTWMRTTMEGNSPTSTRLDVVVVSTPESLELLQLPGVAPFLDRLDPIVLDTLDRDAAYDMVVQAFGDQGVHFQRTAATEVVRLTAGNPYYIAVFMEVVEKMLNERPTRWVVTSKDVVRCTADILRHPLCWHSAVNEPGRLPHYHRCLATIARLQTKNDDYVARGTVIDSTGLEPSVVEPALQRFVDYRLLERLVSPARDDRYRFKAPLVRAWVQRIGERNLASAPQI